MVAPYPAPRRFPELPTTAHRRHRDGSQELYGDLPGITCDRRSQPDQDNWFHAAQEIKEDSSTGAARDIK